MKQKGFTLIELLAVIVVLAIIAIIAVPTITKVVEKSRRGAAVSSAYGYIDAIEKYIALAQIKNNYMLKSNSTYQITDNGEDTIDDIYLNDIINVKGTKPDFGSVTIGEKGNIISVEMVISNYNVECDSKSCKAISKYNGKIRSEGEITVSEEPDTVYIGKEKSFNVTGTGDLSVTSSDNSIITASIEDGVLKLKGVKEGNAKITIISASNETYRRKKVTFDVTSEVFLVCRLVSGESQAMQSKYECDPGDGVKRYFYIIGSDDTTVSLLMHNASITRGCSAQFDPIINQYKELWTNVNDVTMPKYGVAPFTYLHKFAETDVGYIGDGVEYPLYDVKCVKSSRYVDSCARCDTPVKLIITINKNALN